MTHPALHFAALLLAAAASTVPATDRAPHPERAAARATSGHEDTAQNPAVAESAAAETRSSRQTAGSGRTRHGTDGRGWKPYHSSY